MESAHHGTCNKASKFASEEDDVISTMPGNIISNILDRLPIQDAVKTAILSRNLMFGWDMRSELVFDKEFFKYLRRKNIQHLLNKENLGSLLLRLKGPITKFVLYIPKKEFADIGDDIGRWIIFLSTKGLKKFVLINERNRKLHLPTHLFSCPELKHLKLHNCFLYPVPSFRGFSNLSSSDLQMVNFESCNSEEFIASYPLYKYMKTSHQNSNGEVQSSEIVKLEKLKKQSLLMRKLDSMARTGSNIFQLMSFLPKLEELDLDYYTLRFLDTRARVTYPCLKTLTLAIDFDSETMVSSAYDFINDSPNLETLKITAIYTGGYSVPPPGSWEVHCGITSKLQLQNVELEGIRESEIEVCFITSLLANSSLLKKMVIIHDYEEPSFWFRSKLLKLHRASSIAKIDFRRY